MILRWQFNILKVSNFDMYKYTQGPVEVEVPVCFPLSCRANECHIVHILNLLGADVDYTSLDREKKKDLTGLSAGIGTAK